MADTKFFNEPITVTASIDPNGQTIPQGLNWQGKNHTLTSVGRQWEADDGRHVLVEAANGDRFEIQLSREDLVWYMRRVWQEEWAV